VVTLTGEPHLNTHVTVISTNYYAKTWPRFNQQCVTASNKQHYTL